MRVVVVDYGLGNLYSVARALEKVGADPVVTSDPATIRNAERLVLPGVGAFADGMAGLTARGLVEPIRAAASRETPLLGICLGAQLLMEEGREFGITPGLGLVPGKVVPFAQRSGETPAKIPHVGWNALYRGPAGERWDDGILADLPEGTEAYFTHSFVIAPSHPEDTVATTRYAGQDITAVVERDNIHGSQFHPEKSGPAGQRILRRFLTWGADTPPDPPGRP